MASWYRAALLGTSKCISQMSNHTRVRIEDVAIMSSANINAKAVKRITREPALAAVMKSDDIQTADYVAFW
jgi:hypothetical protein